LNQWAAEANFCRQEGAEISQVVQEGMFRKVGRILQFVIDRECNGASFVATAPFAIRPCKYNENNAKHFKIPPPTGSNISE